MLKIAYAPIYKLNLPEGHRFPMAKYELIPQQLLYEGTISEEHLFEPTPLDDATIIATHTPQYWMRMKGLQLTEKEMRRIGFPLSQQLVERCITIANGTIQCALHALHTGVAMNVAGGTHHAFADRGEGFCLLNDIAIAANYLINNNLRQRILIVDLDVHQGNGTARLFNDHPNGWKMDGSTEGGVFTFSMHGANNYPLHKEQSHLDIGLPDGVEDAFYLKVLTENLSLLIDSLQPDFMFYNSGVDILETDKLGRLKVSLNGCKSRDRIVFEAAHRHRIPIAVSMGGGYSARLATIVEAHANTFRVAQEVFF